MRKLPWEEFWWNNITGPHMVVSNVTNALLDNKMVILRVPSDLPWRHSMRSAIHSSFIECSRYSDVVIEPIDIHDDNAEQLEPGRFILERFASSTVKKGYRNQSKVSIQNYISSKSVIKNRIVWVKGLEKEAVEKWVSLCRGFKQRKASDGLFVLEIHDDISINEIGLLKLIDFSNYVSNYDVQLFNSFVLAEQGVYDNNWKKYISTCAAMVCDIDAEVSELLLRIIDFRTESVVEGIKRIAEMEDFARRGEDELSKHILWNYRKENLSEIEHRIWASQIQVLFPIIELERVKLVKKYEKEIQTVLDNDSITQYGDQLTEAIDTELGTFCHLIGKRDNKGNYSLYLPNEEDRERIRFLHKCRNNLAHAECCSPEQVCGLLE